MRYASVCSGVGTCALAWHKLGWTTSWFCEIADFPAAVLKHRWPSVPNHGDMLLVLERAISAEAKGWDNLTDEERALLDLDLLAGGCPCQAFSIAGNRASLEDARGNLTLAFCELADAIDAVRPGGLPFVCYENVPGLLSTKDNAFGCFLGKLCGNGAPLIPPTGVHKRGWKRSKQPDIDQRFTWPDAGVVHGPTRTVAWRILDSQYFGLAQRRRRVIVVASPRSSGHDPAELLLELGSVRRDSPPSRKAWSQAANPAAQSADAGVATAFGGNNTSGPIPVAAALNANRGAHNPGDFETGTLLVHRGQTQTGEDFTHPLSTNCGLAQETGEGLGNGAPLVTDAPPVDVGMDRSAYQCHGSNVGPMGALRAGNGNEAGGVPFTLDVIPINEIGKRCGKKANKKDGTGIGKAGDPAFTLMAGAVQGVAVPEVMGPLLAGNEGQGYRCGADEAAAGMIIVESPTVDTHPENNARSVALRGRDGGATAELGDDLANALRASQGGGDKPYVLTGVVLDEPLPFDTTNITSPKNYSNPQPGDPCHALAVGMHPPSIAFSCKDHGADAGELSPTLRAMGHSKSHPNAGGQVAVCITGEITHTLKAEGADASEDGTGRGNPLTVQDPKLAVRRLTPRETERLQGYPDDHTLVPFGSKGKPAADGPRYRAIGNGWSEPVFAWIGRRIQASTVASEARKP